MPSAPAVADQPILVEFETAPRVRAVARRGKGAEVRTVSRKKRQRTEDLIKESERAVDSAMSTMEKMARKVTDKMDSLKDAKPDEVKLAFGLKLDVEAGALIAKAGAEASLNVTMVWKTGAD